MNVSALAEQIITGVVCRGSIDRTINGGNIATRDLIAPGLSRLRAMA
jgi:hypothetical protein